MKSPNVRPKLSFPPIAQQAHLPVTSDFRTNIRFAEELGLSTQNRHAILWDFSQGIRAVKIELKYPSQIAHLQHLLPFLTWKVFDISIFMDKTLLSLSTKNNTSVLSKTVYSLQQPNVRKLGAVAFKKHCLFIRPPIVENGRIQSR